LGDVELFLSCIGKVVICLFLGHHIDLPAVLFHGGEKKYAISFD